MLTATDLAGMRETLEESLPDTCTVSTPNRTADSAGGWTDTPTVTTSACRVSPLATAGRDFEAVTAGLTISSVPWVLTFPAGTEIAQEATIAANGKKFEIIAVGDDRSYEIDVRLICRRVA